MDKRILEVEEDGVYVHYCQIDGDKYYKLNKNEDYLVRVGIDNDIDTDLLINVLHMMKDKSDEEQLKILSGFIYLGKEKGMDCNI